MNRGYFGDVRDLFKFDLIKEIIQGFEKIERFTYIPMLTNDDDKHGNIRNFEVNLNTSPLCIFSGDVAFFFLAKKGKIKEDLPGILKEYSIKYPDLEVI